MSLIFLSLQRGWKKGMFKGVKVIKRRHFSFRGRGGGLKKTLGSMFPGNARQSFGEDRLGRW